MTGVAKKLKEPLDTLDVYNLNMNIILYTSNTK